MRDAFVVPRGCSLGVVWMGPREAASEERAAAAALREDLAVVLPPSGRCACARGIYGLAYATRHIHLSSFSRPAGPGAIRAGCHALRDRVGLRDVFVQLWSKD